MSTKTPRAITDALEALPLFRGLTKAELELVDQHTTTVSIPQGATLCREGELGREAFIVTSGEADVTVGGSPVAHVGPGAVLGEMALLDCKTRSATVTAATPMTVLVMSSVDFGSIVHAVNAVSRRLLTTLSERLRDADRLVLAP